MLRILNSLCALTILGALANAQVTQFEGKPIVDIQFPDVQPLDPADLAKAQPLEIGQPLRSADVAHAIDGLFITGMFDDIVVEGSIGQRSSGPLRDQERLVCGWRYGTGQSWRPAQSWPDCKQRAILPGNAISRRGRGASARQHQAFDAG